MASEPWVGLQLLLGGFVDVRWQEVLVRVVGGRQVLVQLLQVGRTQRTGCLFQALWNQQSGQPVAQGVSDYDVFYFDDSDLSYEAEDAVIQRVAQRFAHLDVKIEVRNQARVHLWYPQRFGRPYPQLKSARDGIDRYLVACTCVGIDVAKGELYSPDPLDDLVAGVLKINPRFADPVQFMRKALSYQARWPWLRIVENGVVNNA